MKAIVLTEFGGPEVLRVQEIPVPECGPGDILIRIHAAGVNRADLLERQGLYPPPAPRPEFQIPGLECAGVVVQVGQRVTRFREGDRVMALVSGGAYAEYVACPQDNAWLIPEELSDIEAAGIPEAFLTAYDALFDKARLKMGQRVLIHAGAGGVGSAAIQLAHWAGLHVVTTVGSSKKVQRVLDFGAERAINYRERDFVEDVRAWSHGAGVDAVLDFIGQDYLSRNLASLKTGGVLVIIGTLSGGDASINLREVLSRRLNIRGTVLRSRPDYDKMHLIQEFQERTMAFFATGQLRAVIDKTFPLEQAGLAHQYMVTNQNVGKIILTVS
ncbi:NAD(P)H-quinone oxidoreductase [Sulfobacillus thermosulfidooxidans]|uniref:NAD(P)H-quinone oxidoreductase n=1 Tax=Sulfobacillus thermosulfidooxidans TaxID=28034 RepID=UPI00096B9FE8|nr:NAD(P)H-quinone oxidoreductase [Sulfobacillus thermosulfidooxidans]OLZ08880.1 NADPH quinone oxidoreductase [Sulfobacillus thermosulfidooxidans]OLZ14752.1 NADPH quinone oxidoreductase [Sulfobacillus thermosulfidooxidans]OLZ22104.1 NADPH quinone oxidoreductase [Sulfobacillus thermosulfidooxidans]